MGRKKKTSRAKKTSKKSSQQQTQTWSIIGIALLVILAVVVFTLLSLSEQDIVATVNGEEISAEQLDTAYDVAIPPSYHQVISKRAFLEETLIGQLLLLQAARESGIEVSPERVQQEYDETITLIGLSEEEFAQNLQEGGVTLDEFKDTLENQIRLVDFLNDTLFSSIDVSQKDIRIYYEDSGLEEQGYVFDDIESVLESQLLQERQYAALENLISQLRENATIVIYLEERVIEKPESSFEDISLEACSDSSHIRAYTSSSCEYCELVIDRLTKLVKQEKGLTLSIWELDTGDNLATPEIESGIPPEELSLFQTYNPESTVPTYLFGCEHGRIGHLPDSVGNLNAEETEFRLALRMI